jgi:uncharacterized repeat protein (TIGR01451 family)
MAIDISAVEAGKLAFLDGVAGIEREKIYELDTDTGPGWIGAFGVWDGSTTGGLPGTQGEGIIIGVIDSGVEPTNPSFAGVGPVDGYVHTNPYGTGVFAGVCDTNDPDYDPTYACNDKLIGAHFFNGSNAYDDDGHGSHTASTSGGNIVDAVLEAPTMVVTMTISGVAPHANIINLKVCDPGCPSSSSVAAVDWGLAQGVDVFNYSISGGDNPWNDSVDLAFLDAFNANAYVSASAGNDGPGASSVAKTGGWNASVAASTHGRVWEKFLQNMSGGDTAAPADMFGQGITTPYGPANIVYAGDYFNPNDPTGDPAQCLEPYPADTWTNGEIVVCDRGAIARVQKGANVLAGGAAGFVLANVDAQGESVAGDPHFLPGIHIGDAAGDVLRAWLASGSDHMAEISDTTLVSDPAAGDVLADFSSRGPSVTGVIKPDFAAPGVSIYAAVTNTPGGDPGYDFLSGTSMSSPHGAGAAALMKALYPSWSPAQLKSALALTANTDMRKEDGVTPADPFDMGSGRISLGHSAVAGLVMDETYTNFVLADPDLGGDPTTLNLPNMQSNECFQFCSWTRVLQNVAPGGPHTYAVSATGPDGMVIDIALSGGSVVNNEVTVASGEYFTVTVDVDVLGAPTEQWHFGEVQLTETSAAVPDSHMPLAVYASSSMDALTLTKSVDHETAPVGEVLEYHISLTNLTLFTNTYDVRDYVPANVTLVPNSWSATSGVMTQTAGNLLDWGGTLQGGSVGLLEIPLYGYIALSNFGVPAFPTPSNPDDGCWLISGLDFGYFGDPYEVGIWSMNGTLEAGMASLSCSSFVNIDMPHPNSPNNLVAPWWTDIQLANAGGAGEIYLATLSDGVNLFDVFEWKGAQLWGDPSSTYSFQIWLMRGTDYVWYTYGDLIGNVGTATVGFEDDTGFIGDSYYFNGAGTLPATDLLIFASTGESVDITFEGQVTGGANGDVLVNEVQARVATGQQDFNIYAWASTTVADANPSLELVKTVAEGSSCGTGDTVVVDPAAETDVTYCYTITNTGNVSFLYHDLADDQFGQLIDNLEYDLDPNDNVTIVVSTTVDTTVVNTATWSGWTDTHYAESTDTASVLMYFYKYLPFIPNH